MRLHRKNNPTLHKLEGVREKKGFTTCKASQDDFQENARHGASHFSVPLFPPGSKAFQKDASSKESTPTILTPNLPSNLCLLKVVPWFRKGASMYQGDVFIGPSTACLPLFCLVFTGSGMLIAAERWSFNLLPTRQIYLGWGFFLLNKALKKKIPPLRGWLSPSTQLAKLCAPSTGMDLIP